MAKHIFESWSQCWSVQGGILRCNHPFQCVQIWPKFQIGIDWYWWNHHWKWHHWTCWILCWFFCWTWWCGWAVSQHRCIHIYKIYFFKFYGIWKKLFQIRPFFIFFLNAQCRWLKRQYHHRNCQDIMSRRKIPPFTFSSLTIVVLSTNVFVIIW